MFCSSLCFDRLYQQPISPLFIICENIFANSLIFPTNFLLQDWFSRQQLVLLVLVVNIALAILFFRMLTQQQAFFTVYAVLPCLSFKIFIESIVLEVLRNGSNMVICCSGLLHYIQQLIRFMCMISGHGEFRVEEQKETKILQHGAQANNSLLSINNFK